MSQPCISIVTWFSIGMTVSNYSQLLETPIPESESSLRCNIVACGGGASNVMKQYEPDLSVHAGLFAADAHDLNLEERFAEHKSIRAFGLNRPAQFDLAECEGLEKSVDAQQIEREIAPLVDLLTDAALPVIVWVCLGGNLGTLSAKMITEACLQKRLSVFVVGTLPLSLETSSRTRAGRAVAGWVADSADAAYLFSNDIYPRRSRRRPPLLRDTFECANAMFPHFTTQALATDADWHNRIR